jgi:hypothetical protein
MREIPEIGFEASTLIAVGVGAVLATAGGFLATMYEAWLRRRERERTAAVTFGEILASLRVLIKAAGEAHGIGDPWGPLTMRLFRGARREVDAYERSRPALSDLRRTDLRLALHAVMIRIALGLDGLLEATVEGDRQGSYEYLLEIAPSLEDLVHRLVPVAGQPIQPYDELSHTPTGVEQSLNRQGPAGPPSPGA